jgi:NADP-dependent 3-hydroxy acid dehydrogenase YdfG
MAVQAAEPRVAVITGAASGIGFACAARLQELGFTVVMLDRDSDLLAESGMQLSGSTPVSTVSCDVSDSNAVAATFNSILSTHSRIDVLVNCAGINRLDRHFTKTSIKDWDAVVNVNLNGMFYCCHAVIAHMRERGHGTIVNFASWAGRHAGYFTGAAYNASKRAVFALTESINIEEGLNGLRATTIVPEEVATAIVDKRPIKPTPEERARMLKPEDVAAAIAFVAGLPPRVCINELVISPTWNRDYLGLHQTALSARK